MKEPRSRPVTLRAMLAADCSELPPRLRHLVHVLALHADNQTGIGLTGQERLARYMGCSARSVRRMLCELEEAFQAGAPVGILREKRWLNSDRYRLVVRAEALLELPRVRDERSPVAGHERSPVTGMSGHGRPVKRSPVTGSLPNEAVTGGLQTTEVALQSNPQSKKDQSFLGPNAPDGAAQKETCGEGESASADSDLSPGEAARRRYGARIAKRSSA